MKQASLRAALAAFLVTSSLAATMPQGIDLYDPAVLRDLHIRFDSESWAQDMFAEYSLNDPTTTGAEFFQDATIEIEGVEYPCEVRYRGQTTFGQVVNYDLTNPPENPFLKLPLEVQLDDDNPFGIDTLRLNNGAFDGSMMREVTMLRLARKFMNAPRANHVRVFMGGPGDPEDEYVGLYINLEHMDREFMRRALWNGEGRRWDRAKLGPQASSCAGYMNYYEPNPQSPTCTLDDVAQFIVGEEQAEALVNGETDAQSAAAAIEPALPLDDWCRYWAVHMASGNPSFEMKGESFEDLYHGGGAIPMPAGIDRSFTSSVDMDPWTNSSWFSAATRTIASLPAVRARYGAYLREILTDGYGNPDLMAFIADTRGLIAPHVPSPNDLHYSFYFDLFDQGIIDAALLEWIVTDTYDQAADTFSELVIARWMDLMAQPIVMEAAPSVMSVTPGDARALSGEPLTVTAQVSLNADWVVLRHRSAASVTEVDMEPLGGGTWVATVSLPETEDVAWFEYVIEARKTTGSQVTASVSPRKGFHDPHTVVVAPALACVPMVINEFLAKNDDVVTNPSNGGTPDVIELFNGSGATLSLGNWSLTNATVGGVDAEAWYIPACPGYEVFASGVLPLWCIGNDAVPGTCDEQPQIGFKLDVDGGEQIALWNEAGELVDAVRFRRQTVDISQSRTPDGGADWTFLTVPTLGGGAGVPTPVLGDFNSDGLVTIADVLVFLTKFGVPVDPCSPCAEDLNGDGAVSTSDLLILFGLLNG